MSTSAPIAGRTTRERDRLRVERQAAYDAAGTIRRYAAAEGLSYGAAHRRLTSVGVTLGKRGARPLDSRRP